MFQSFKRNSCHKSFWNILKLIKGEGLFQAHLLKEWTMENEWYHVWYKAWDALKRDLENTACVNWTQQFDFLHLKIYPNTTEILEWVFWFLGFCFLVFGVFLWTGIFNIILKRFICKTSANIFRFLFLVFSFSVF